MMNKSKMIRFLSLSLGIVGFVLISGYFTTSNAQTRDPFEKPSWAKPRNTNPTPTTTATTTTTTTGKMEKPKPPGPPPVIVVLPPTIEQRISYYKRLREDAASNGVDIPKVTSVLTLDEMAVIGIFRTPRGYAAMVEAKPIKLTYTIYPGEKFFDGQLVAVEENRLVFRKVTKMSNGKFTASVENKILRQYSVQEEVQGTAPIQPSANSETASTVAPVPTADKDKIPMPTMIISPLDEMNRQPPAEQPKDSVKEKPSKKGKKPVKVAKNKVREVEVHGWGQRVEACWRSDARRTARKGQATDSTHSMPVGASCHPWRHEVPVERVADGHPERLLAGLMKPETGRTGNHGGPLGP